MTDDLFILAQRSTDDGDGGWIKMLFGALVFLFWAISAIATWLNKKHEEARRQRVREQLNQGAPEPGVRPVPARGQVGMRPPPPPPMQPPMPKRFPQRAPKPPRQPAKRARAVPVPPPLPASEEVTDATTLPVTATEIAAPARTSARSTAVSAASIAHWLRPQTLRQQFILTEILQPPLALRPPRD